MNDKSGVRIGVLGLALLIVAGLALRLGLSEGHPVATVLGIVAGVLGLAALRARSWIRKEQVLRRVGEDLHLPEDD